MGSQGTRLPPFHHRLVNSSPWVTLEEGGSLQASNPQAPHLPPDSLWSLWFSEAELQELESLQESGVGGDAHIHR